MSERLASLMGAAADELTHSLQKYRASTEHPGLKGDGIEMAVRRFLRAHLPQSIGIATGHVMDSEGTVSKQLDVILYDATKTPILFSDHDATHRLIPAEGVLAVIEVKAKLLASSLDSIFANMDSVKALKKAAFFANNTVIVRTTAAYGLELDHFPILYFVLAFEGERLDSLAGKLDNGNCERDLAKGIDSICVLNQGVVVHSTQHHYDIIASPDSVIGAYPTRNALLLWYLMLSRWVLQAYTGDINLIRYFPDFRF